jgi:hypothetical protein
MLWRQSILGRDDVYGGIRCYRHVLGDGARIDNEAASVQIEQHAPLVLG